MDEILIIGHVSDDFRNEKRLLGGPPLYQAPVLSALGEKVHIITSAAENFKFPNYQNCIFDVIIDQYTTTYEFSVSEKKDSNIEGERNLLLVSRASPIKYSEVKNKLHNKYEKIIISPITALCMR